jgi:hypothetical protein
MKLDVYRRPEPEHMHSFMVVPAGDPIPQEVENTDWKLVAENLDLDVDAGSLADYAIDDPSGQIREKGYAITSVTHQVPD